MREHRPVVVDHEQVTRRPLELRLHPRVVPGEGEGREDDAVGAAARDDREAEPDQSLPGHAPELEVADTEAAGADRSQEVGAVRDAERRVEGDREAIDVPADVGGPEGGVAGLSARSRIRIAGRDIARLHRRKVGELDELATRPDQDALQVVAEVALQPLDLGHAPSLGGRRARRRPDQPGQSRRGDRDERDEPPPLRDDRQGRGAYPR
jgi:hypothetical protein